MGLPPLNLSFADASTTAVNPLAGLLGGGFVFSPQHSFGGSGNSQASTANPTTTQTPTLAPTISGKPAMSAATPFADGLLGFSQPASIGDVSGNWILPAAIVGGAFLLALALRRN